MSELAYALIVAQRNNLQAMLRNIAQHLIAGDYGTQASNRKLEAIQDGADFYAEEGGHIASYPHMVRNDQDMAGVVHARTAFLRDFPDYFFS